MKTEYRHEQAARFVKERLANGPQDGVALRKAAIAAGFTQNLIYVACRRLGVTATRTAGRGIQWQLDK